MNFQAGGDREFVEEDEDSRLDLQRVRQQLDKRLVGHVVAEENVVAEGSRARSLDRRDRRLSIFASESSTIAVLLVGILPIVLRLSRDNLDENGSGDRNVKRRPVATP